MVTSLKARGRTLHLPSLLTEEKIGKILLEVPIIHDFPYLNSTSAELIALKAQIPPALAEKLQSDAFPIRADSLAGSIPASGVKEYQEQSLPFMVFYASLPRFRVSVATT